MNGTAARQDIRMVLEASFSADEIAQAWRQLDRTGAHSFFLSWTWMGTWLRALPPAERPALVRAMDGDALAGLATLAFRRARYGGIFPLRQAWLNATGNSTSDCIMIEHNGFASAGAQGATFLPALARAFEAREIAADELVLPGIASADTVETGLIDAGHTSPAFRAPLQGLGGGEGIEPLLSRNARQQLRRSMRACERKGTLKIEIAQDAQTALEFFNGLKALHTRSWLRRGRSHAFANPFFETFHRALIAQGLEDGNVDLVRVSAGASVLGYLYNFRRNNTVSSYQSGFDDTDAALRPGYVCHALAMAHYAKAGMTAYDFLAGTNRLKESFGPERYALHWRRLRRKTPVFRAGAAARKSLRLLRRRG